MAKEKMLELAGFDTAEGIIRNINSYEDFVNLVKNRSNYYLSTRKNLHEFILWAKIRLNECGGIDALILPSKCTYQFSEIEEYEVFRSWYNNHFAYSFGIEEIPTLDVGMKCPLCKKEFTLEDIKAGDITNRDPTFDYLHKHCRTEKIQKNNVEYIEGIFSEVYGEGSFELTPIPNEAKDCNCYICQSRTWFIVKTPDGKIKIGPTKRKESITFPTKIAKKIDLNKLFANGEVTKSGRKSPYIVYTYGKTDTVEHLRMVKEALKQRKRFFTCFKNVWKKFFSK